MDQESMVTPLLRPGPTSRIMRRKSTLIDPKSAKASLERSLQLLDQALGSPAQPAMTGEINPDMTTFMRAPGNTSLLRKHVLDTTRPMDSSMRVQVGDSTRPFHESMNLMSATLSSAMLEENPGVKGTENLFGEFLSVSSTGNQGLDTVAEFEQMIGDHIYALRRVIQNLPTSKGRFSKTSGVLQDLINERNTWRILGKLYADRLVTCAQAPVDLPPPSPGSEKQIINRFFLKNHDVRQAYMVVDWLEKNAQDEHEQTITQQMEWFSDMTICWENTTAALSRGQRGTHMVKELDPDAPHRTGLQLHDLDQQDEVRLVTCVYALVRCGLLEDAQELCVRMGQPWRAATLEGWKLYHDPNYESGTDGRGDKLPVEGNKYRDVWKKVAWGLTKDSNLPQHERSIYAALCGNLNQLRAISASWEDRLWAGAKCAVDVMVESEIRSNLTRSFAELPTEYWNTPTAMPKVLKEAYSSSGTDKQDEIYRTIQSYIILNDYPGLLLEMVNWVETEDLEAHLLRMLAHIVLIHKSLGLVGDEGTEERVLLEYTRFLMRENMMPLIPWYVGRLRPHTQVPLYSQFLAGVYESEDQALCLYLGREVGLNMAATVVAAVQSVRAADNPDFECMVSSLAWLSHDPAQAPDLLYQTNAVIRRLLAAGQIELAGQAAAKIPKETLGLVVRAWREEEGGEELPRGSVREHLALKVYLEAQDAFSDWFDHFHRGQPKPPTAPTKPSFTEKVAHEQRTKQYTAELERWRGGQIIQSRQAEQKLRDVLNFPGGWLTAEDDDCGDGEEEEDMMESEEKQRRMEMLNLRSEILPQTVQLLHSVLHNTGQFKACVSLANVVVDEQSKNYAAFSKEKIQQILLKIRESSLAVMEQGKDPWGFPKP